MRVFGSAAALPAHLANWNGTGKPKLHNDWPWPLAKLPRSINAFGPRCPVESGAYRPWPPRLVKGFGVTRWESNGAASILEVPAFAGRWITAAEVYGKTWPCIERNPGHPDYGQQGTAALSFHAMPWSEIETGALAYSPSALQEFGPKSWLRMGPFYVAEYRPGRYFYRVGFRPDHLDVYYNWGPFLGVNVE